MSLNRHLQGEPIFFEVPLISLMKVADEGFELNAIEEAKQLFIHSTIILALFEANTGSSNTSNTSLGQIIEIMSKYCRKSISLYDTSLIQLQNKICHISTLFASIMPIDSLLPLSVKITNKSWSFKSRK